MKLQYLEQPVECYKTVNAKYEGEKLKYKMKSLRSLPIERPNDSVIQSIAKRFITQRYSERIYSSNYGVDWERFIGRDMNEDLAMDLEEEIRQALMVSEYVESVDVSLYSYSGDTVLVNCEVTVKDNYVTDNKTITLRASL